MTSLGILQIAVFFVLVLLVTKPLGAFMAKVFQGQRTFLHPVLRPLERLIYRLGGVREDTEQRWTQYAASVIAFSVASFLFVYAIQRLQGFLPFNPMHFGTKAAPSGAISRHPGSGFQYRHQLSHQHQLASLQRRDDVQLFVQMAALAVQNFASAAVGISVAVALIRGFARQEANSIGNFWVDLTRSTFTFLLPIAFVAALMLCSQGAIQNFLPYTTVKTLEGAAQTIPQGPVASQEAIKMLGTNGGGFFNANSSHPFENPTPLTDLLQVLLIFMVPGGADLHFRPHGGRHPAGLGACLPPWR